MDDRYERSFYQKERKKANKRDKSSRAKEARKEAQSKPREYSEPSTPPLPPAPAPVSGRVIHLRTLGLEMDQDIPAVIRSTYRRLALQYHPDKNDAPDACSIFREITASYEILCA